MSTEFDGQKALKEEISGITGVLHTINVLVQRSEQKMSEAAAEHDALLKLQGFAKGEVARKRKVLRQLEDANATR